MRRLSALLALSLLLFLSAPVRAQSPHGPLLIVLLPGTSLSDWRGSDTPNLHRLMATGAVAVMNTRTARLPNDHTRESAQSAALTLGAGSRAAGGTEVTDFHPPNATVPGLPLTYSQLYARRMGMPSPPGDWVNAQWPRVLAENNGRGYDLLPGNLGEALRRHGVSIQAGGGAYAFPIACSAAGVVTAVAPGGRLPDPLPDCLVWDAGSDTTDADGLLGAAAAQVAAQRGRLLLLSPFARDANYAQGKRLTPVLLWGPEVPPGLLYSPSTHHAGLVANTDFAPSVIAWLAATAGAEWLPSPAFGRPWSVRAAPNAVGRVYLLEQQAYAQAAALRALPAVAIALGGLVLAGAAFSRTQRWGQRMIPLPGFLILALVVSPSLRDALVCFAALTALAWCLKARLSLARMILGVGLLLVMTLTADICLGNPLMGHSLLGYSVVEGARYYGIGNEAMGALIGGALLCGAFLWPAGLIGRISVISALGVIALLLGLPSAGAKAGGLLVAIAGFCTLVWSLWGGRWSGRVVIAILGLMFVTLLAASVADLHRHNDQRSHFGQAIGRIQSGGAGEAADIVLRKLTVETRLAYHSAWAVPLWASIFGLSAFLRVPRWSRHQRGRALLVGSCVAILTTLLVNDAGVVAAALCGSLSWSGAAAMETEEGSRRTEDDASDTP